MIWLDPAAKMAGQGFHTKDVQVACLATTAPLVARGLRQL